MVPSIESASAPILRHVVARSRGRRSLFADASARGIAARRLASACDRHGLKCLVWCITDRCLHFVVRGAASEITLATDEFARSGLRHGHWIAATVNLDIYLLEVARHALDAPVRGRLVRRVIDWPHSSARESLGFARPSPWLDPSPLYDLLGPRDGKGPERLRRFMNEGASPVVAFSS